MKDGGATARDGMNHFGRQLKAERDRQSLDLGKVAGSIRVREQYLDAIERHDWDALPEPVFTRGYIQSYAQYLRMDPKLVLNAYAREMRIARATQPPTEQAEEESSKVLLERLARTQGLDLSRSWWKTRWTTVAIVVIAACAGAAAWRFIAAHHLAASSRQSGSSGPVGSFRHADRPERVLSMPAAERHPSASVPPPVATTVPSPVATTVPSPVNAANIPTHAVESSSVGAAATDPPASDSPSSVPEPPQPPARSAIVSPPITSVTKVPSDAIESSRMGTNAAGPAAAGSPSVLPEPPQPPARSETASHPVRSAAPSSNNDISAARLEIDHANHDNRVARFEISETDHDIGAAGLAITDFGVGTGVSNRQLVGRSDRFEEGSVVWFWTHVLEGREGDTIRHVWLHEGRVVGIVPLSVGGPQWRTHSRRRLGPGSSGSWSVEARDDADRILATTTFSCGSSAEGTAP